MPVTMASSKRQEISVGDHMEKRETFLLWRVSFLHHILLAYYKLIVHAYVPRWYEFKLVQLQWKTK